MPLLIQLTFLFALYYVFISGLKSDSLNLLYPFVFNPGHLNETFLGVISMTGNKNIIFALLAGATQFIQSKMMLTSQPPRVKGSEDESMANIMNQQMTYVMPIMTAVIGYQLPAGLSLYWAVNGILGILQQYFIFTKKSV